MAMRRVRAISAHLTAEGVASKSESGFDENWQPRLVAKPGQTMGELGKKHGDDVVIVSAFRTALTKAKTGGFKDTYTEDMLAPVLAAVCDKVGLDKKHVDDIVIGNVGGNGFVGNNGMSGAAACKFQAGFPETVACSTTNRACSSGLSAMLIIAGEIRAGAIEVGIGAGVEKLSAVGGGSPMAGNEEKHQKIKLPDRKLMQIPAARETMIPMGITAEEVSLRYGIKREDQDRLAFESHSKAVIAQKEGFFKGEIIPVTTTVRLPDGTEKEVTVDSDDGIRATTMETLAKLKPAFKAGGSTTAGSSSQVSDGAAAVLMMKRSRAEELGMPVLAAMRASALVGVPPDVMGIGPAFSIPEVLKKANLNVTDVSAFEVNEAFASQAEYTVQKVGIPRERLNPCGGAIALGHPFGATGCRQVATLLPHLKRTGGKYGITSMCMGTGMGMAALFENEQ